MLERLRPPAFPDEVFNAGDPALGQILDWKRSTASSALAGLLTDPQFHGNTIRLEWLQRLVLSKSTGKRKPQQRDLSSALNDGLDRSGVLRLEDPIEDLFCDRIATRRGDLRIFLGVWEGATAYTQTLLDAFEALPAGAMKDKALRSAYALLQLSEALAARADVDRITQSSGQPARRFTVPASEDLKRLARRVRFSDADLRRLEIDKEALASFLLQSGQEGYVSDRPAGETPLEYHPLEAHPSGITVLIPSNLSVAVRAVLVNAANTGGMGEALQQALLLEQEAYSERSGFWPVSSVRLSAPNQYMMRASVCAYAPGRFLHVLQLPATFDDFPRRGFGSVRRVSREASQFVAQDIERFWNFLRQQPDCRLGVTVLLLGGWGTPHSIDPPINDADAPANWLYLPLSFMDAAVLGACEHGKLRSILRMLQQLTLLEQDGFTFQYLNGIANLFGFWRTTDGNLIPEHLAQIEPPCSLSLPTDELLVPRREAARHLDVRALPTLPAGFKVVQRLDWDNPSDLKPIYASLEDARQNRLLGASVFGHHVWWLECSESGSSDRNWRYRVWHALFQWIAAVGSILITKMGHAFPDGPRMVEVIIPPRLRGEPIDPAGLGRQHARDALTVHLATDGIAARVDVGEAWLQQLGAAANDAEVELIAAVLEGLAAPAAVTRAVLAEAVHAAIGSADWRWLHIRESLTPLDYLAGAGLIGAMREPSLSAHSVAKCQSVWTFWDRSRGLEVTGEDNCKDFLANYRSTLLAELTARIRVMNRQELVMACAGQYQAARAEQEQWRSTIRAMRAIRGTAADVAAFKRQNAVNSVARAAKTICEIAACDAATTGGLMPYRDDLDELFALALLIVGSGQLFALIGAGLHEPELRISPAGDLLSDHSVQTTVLRPTVELMNRRVLDDAAESYLRRRSREQPGGPSEQSAWTPALCAAIETEYQTPVDSFINLQYALVRMAEARHDGVFTMRRSELANVLNADKDFPSDDVNRFLERLTLPSRAHWLDIPAGLSEADFNLSRFDRPYSIINRPLVALDESTDPLILIAPLFVSDACMYSFAGLREGTLNNTYWTSNAARAYAGSQGHAMGERFEDDVGDRLRKLGLDVWTRRALSWALNMKVDPALGNIDVLAVSPDRRRVWVIEAKNLRLCRTETEIASRLSEYRGRMTRGSKGREAPDKMLRHMRRVEFMRSNAKALCSRLKLNSPPEVRGLLVVDAPQPMNFFAAGQLADGQTVMLDAVDDFQF
ncbi:hypothetical protein RAD15_06495 [Bradyrhizobium sp. 14AA]